MQLYYTTFCQMDAITIVYTMIKTVGLKFFNNLPI